MKQRTRVYTHVDCYDHQPGEGHPESPQRLALVLEALKTSEFSALDWKEAPLGTRAQAELIHDADYYDAILEALPARGAVPLDGGDTMLSAGSWQALMRCIGAACAGVDDVMLGQAANVFCATRPCGHHAEPDRAMGFCIFNHAAIAAAHASRLFYASCHQSPLYPGTGLRSETGSRNNILNIPLPQGCDSPMFRDRIRHELIPALRNWAPELIVISAGFDAHREDPLAGLQLVDADFHWITRELMEVAAETAQGRIVSILEGGYSMAGLTGGTSAHVRALMA
eukprot:gene28133-34945_t